MSESTNNENNLRNSKQGQQAMPMPSGSGAMLTCKVPAKRPMPCVIIAIHGVNDDGQFMPLIDKHICAGLNKRLGRDDLTPHKWGVWKEGSENTIPELTPGGPSQSPCILEEGRSPVIPFHWGYRPVDKKAYFEDQRRYKSQLDASNRDPDLPYDAYYIDERNDARKGYACHDNFDNWLSEQYSKDGGPFPNATNNLVDMWGPGVSGRLYSTGVAATGVLLGSEGRLYKNPHRIYYVHAARRLADLILEIRRNPLAKDDAINIIAHSQGTEITMLANFMVQEAKLRPADNVILCDSPYALEPNAVELEFPGKHQSREARVQTLSNFVKLMREARRPVEASRNHSDCPRSSATRAPHTASPPLHDFYAPGRSRLLTPLSPALSTVDFTRRGVAPGNFLLTRPAPGRVARSITSRASSIPFESERCGRSRRTRGWSPKSPMSPVCHYGNFTIHTPEVWQKAREGT